MSDKAGLSTSPADSIVDTDTDGDLSSSLESVVALVRAGLWKIALSVLLSVLAGLFYVWYAQPIYKADALVQVEKEGGNKALDQAIGDINTALGGEVPISAELEIIRSRMILGRVANELQLNVVVEPQSFPLVGRAMARHSRSSGRPVAPPFDGGAEYAWGGEALEFGSFEVPDAYLNKPWTLRAGSNGRYTLLQNGAVFAEGTVGQTLVKEVPGGKGRLRLSVQKLVARPGTLFRVTRMSANSAISRIDGALTVNEQGKFSGIINIEYKDPNPERAQRVLNELLNAYVRQNVERRSQDAAQTLEFLGQQLPGVRQKVEQADAALRDYQLAQNSVDLMQESQQMLQQVVNLETTRLTLRQERDAALRKFTEANPAVRDIEQRLVSVGGEISRIEDKVRQLPSTQQRILALRRDVESNTALYTSMLNTFQQLQVAKVGTVGNVRIIDPAILPMQPISPKKGFILVLSVVLGLLLGLAWVVLQSLLHQGIEDPAVIERALGLPTYAAIPYVRAQTKISALARRLKHETLPILALADPGNQAVESLRSLRTSLHFAMLEADNNIIMVTGPAPRLGKSFTSINLSAVLAMSGKTVAVVDADMRRGYLHEYVSRERAPGLSEYITGQATLDNVLRPTQAAGMMLVSTGEIPPNPSELLLHPRFKALLDELSPRFDYVLVDTPPILAVTDASIVGALAGTTMMILKAGEHDLRSIAESLRRLRQSGSNVRGTIFNQMGRSGHAYSYKQGYQYGYQYDYRAKKAT